MAAVANQPAFVDIRNAKAPDYRPDPATTTDISELIWPQYAMFCDIDLKMNGAGTKFELKYMGMAWVKLTDIDNDAEKVFNKTVLNFANGRQPPNLKNFNPNAGHPNKSDLSVCIDELAFVAIRLEWKNQQQAQHRKNWLISRYGPPITVSGRTGTHGRAWEAARVNTSGGVGGGVVKYDGNDATKHIPCDVAYFIYEPDKRDAQQQRYMDFNIHIEVSGSGSTFVPIIIDPDVGWPGGNKP